MPGPDFPTGGIILGRAGIRGAYHTGRGSIVMRGKVAIETLRREREAIIITEIPYQVNKATMIESIAELVRDKRIEGIADMRDESDRDGYRVVIELKRDAMRRRGAQPALPLHAAAIDLRRQHGGARRRPAAGDDAQGHARRLRRLPRGGGLAAHQVSCSARRATAPMCLVGLAIAVANIDEVIKLIRAAQGRQRGARGLDGARLAGDDDVRR